MWYCDRCNRHSTDSSEEHEKKCDEFRKEKEAKMSKCVCGAEVRDTIIHFGYWLNNEENVPIGVIFRCGTELMQDSFLGWKTKRTTFCYSQENYNLKQRIKELEK